MTWGHRENGVEWGAAAYIEGGGKEVSIHKTDEPKRKLRGEYIFTHLFSSSCLKAMLNNQSSQVQFQFQICFSNQ